jgi:antirestriction protein ArdC
MARTLTKEQRERRATAVRELLAAMRQAYEEDPTTRAHIDAMEGCVTNADGRPYSWNNLLLLAGQCREHGITPTQVAAFGAWLKRGRAPRKGEKGLAIYAPHPRRDEETGEQEEEPGFHVTYVFDVSQTEPVATAGD